MDTSAIIREILKDYELPIGGDHGVVHWARVLENGLRLAPMTGASTEIVTLFAIFHDSRRVNEFDDDGHGLRGAEFALSCRGKFFNLNDLDFDLLYEACRLHTGGLRDGDMTLQGRDYSTTSKALHRRGERTALVGSRKGRFGLPTEHS